MVVNLAKDIKKVSVLRRVADFEGQPFSFKLTHFSFDSCLIRYAPWASFTSAHTSLNDLKFIYSSVYSN